MSTESLLSPMNLTRGTALTTDLQSSRRFCEEFLGLEVVQHHQGGFLARDDGTSKDGRLNGHDYWVLEFQVKEDIDTPQGVFNHWGVDVATREEVDVAHAAAYKYKKYFGIDEIDSIKNQHGSYAFYFSDVFGNWWEVQSSNMTDEEREAWRNKRATAEN